MPRGLPEPWEGSDKYKCPPTCRPLLCTEIFTGAPKSKRNKRKNETIGSAGRTGTIRTANSVSTARAGRQRVPRPWWCACRACGENPCRGAAEAKRQVVLREEGPEGPADKAAGLTFPSVACCGYQVARPQAGEFS